MRFLIKAAFWLTLAFVFIPVLEGKKPAIPRMDQPSGQTAVSQHPVPSEGLPGDVRGGLSMVTDFCSSNAAICDTGQSIITSAGLTARDAAFVVYQYLDAQFGHPVPPHNVGAADDIDMAIRRAFGDDDVDRDASTGAVQRP